MTDRAWKAPPIWSVPRSWVGDRCYVLCGGESLRAQEHDIPNLRGRVIAVKDACRLRPDADAWFFAGEQADVIAPPLLNVYRGPEIVVRGKGHPVFPSSAKRIGRTTTHTAWSSDPTKVAGLDSGTSAINLAILYGSTEIVLLGYDMQGGRWFGDRYSHPMPVIPEAHFERHMVPLHALAADARAKGIRIVNCSHKTRVKAFEQRSFEEFR